MALKFDRRLSRRGFVGTGAGLAGSALMLGGVPSRIAATAAQGTTTNRFLQINLVGGWDSAFATDPVIGKEKETSSGYQIDYREPIAGMEPMRLSAKPTLAVGPGLVPAEAAFTMMPTAFINGIYMQVPGHEFAYQYMNSGRLTLSQGRDYPAIPAILGADLTTFPPHVVVGSPIPLGDSLYTSPPLHGAGFEPLAMMLKGPSGQYYDEDLVKDADALIAKLDAGVYASLPTEHLRDLQYWQKASGHVGKIYSDKMGGGLTLTDPIRERYGIDRYLGDATEGPERQLAAAFVLMQQNICRYVTVGIGGYWDTHFNHLLLHLPYMKRFGAALSVFVRDLLDTDDPATPGRKLADTTTIMISSEFVRSPVWSAVGGAEHWSSASVILMGRGVKDGAMIGATDQNGYALGWSGGQAVSYSEATQLLPDHVIATILQSVGTTAQANTVSEVRVDGLFA